MMTHPVIDSPQAGPPARARREQEKDGSSNLLGKREEAGVPPGRKIQAFGQLLSPHFTEPTGTLLSRTTWGDSIRIGRDDLTAIERGEPPQDDNAGAVPEEVHAAVTEESIDTAGMVGVKRLVVSGLVARGAQDSRISLIIRGLMVW